MDRDLVLDDAQDAAGGAHRLVDRQAPEERLVLRVVDARDGARHVEAHLGHLARDQVVLVVAGDRRHDVGARHAGLRLVAPFAAVVGDHDAAQLVGDRPGAARVLLDHDDLVARGEQLLGQVVADVSAADDDHVHQPASPSGRASMMAAAAAAAAREPAGGTPWRGSAVGGSHCPAGRLGALRRPPTTRASARMTVRQMRLEAERPIGLGPQRVVDLGDDPRDAEDVLAQLGGQSHCGCRPR